MTGELWLTSSLTSDEKDQETENIDNAVHYYEPIQRCGVV